jgi:hypothetical protein
MQERGVMVSDVVQEMAFAVILSKWTALRRPNHQNLTTIENR